MNNPREEIHGWLEEVFGTQEEAGGVSIISLTHIDGYGRELEIYSVKSGGTKWGDVPALTEVLYRFADRHSRNLPGAQSFKLQAMFGPENRPLRFLPIQMTGALHFGALPGGGMATEPPTATGQLQQAMRLTEQQAQLAHAQVQHATQTQHQIIEGLRAENLAYKRENAELWIAAKDLIVDMLKMRHDTRMGELAAARAAEFQRQVMALAPALVNMMAGKDIFPSAVAEKSLLDGLAAGTSPEQMRTFAAIVASQVQNGDKLSAVLMEHYNKYHEKVARQAAEEKRLLNNTPGVYDTGERDAAGEAIKILRGGSHQEVEKQLPPAGATVMKALENVIDETPKGNGAANEAPTATEKVNGAGVHGPAPAVTKEEGDALLDVMLEGASESEIDMLSGILAAKRPDVPDLADRIKTRFAAITAKRT